MPSSQLCPFKELVYQYFVFRHVLEDIQYMVFEFGIIYDDSHSLTT